MGCPATGGRGWARRWRGPLESDMPLEPPSVPLSSASIEPFRDLLEADQWEEFIRSMRETAGLLKNATVWNINSTAHGGGVAELLESQIPYQRELGIDVRWLVIQGGRAFFTFTKRLHTLLHGIAANGATISADERAEYEQTLGRNVEALTGQIRAGDVAILHDPQTAGLIPHLVRRRCRVVWRSHIGVDQPNDVTRGAWRFLMPFVRAAHATVFSRHAYVWEGLDEATVDIIPPSIDAFTPKNQEMDAATVAAILETTGILAGGGPRGKPDFRLRDGSPRRVARPSQLFPEGAIPADARLVVQVSRWDRLKDPLGVMEGFAQFVAPKLDGHLILAGPGVSAVADDPEEPAVLGEVEDHWQRLPAPARERIHLARLPMEDQDENAAVVNALQRRADVVVQKSLGEGFGLTVAQAMWKGRAGIARRVGGIQDQNEHGLSGLLIDDPHHPARLGAAVAGVLSDPVRAQRLGNEAKQRVRRH